MIFGWLADFKSEMGNGGSQGELAFAELDVIVNGNGDDDENPYRKDSHSGDGFRDQAWQNCPSTTEDQKEE